MDMSRYTDMCQVYHVNGHINNKGVQIYLTLALWYDLWLI